MSGSGPKLTFEQRADVAGAQLRGSEERSKIMFEAKNNWADRAREAEAEVRRLQAKVSRLESRGIEDMRHSIEAALALHIRNEDGDCTGCSDDRNYTVSWPCPTVEALRGES